MIQEMKYLQEARRGSRVCSEQIQTRAHARYDRRNASWTAAVRIQSGPDGCIRLCATLRCEEMIARMQPANLKEAIE